MTPVSTFVDNFPCDPGADNFATHAKIDADLRNCDALWPNAPMGTLLPGCSKESAGDRSLQLAAALERVEWHCVSPQPESEKWLLYLTSMLRLIGYQATGMDDDTLLRLARVGHHLRRNKGGADFHDLASVVAKALAERKASLSPELTMALESLVDHLVRIHDHSANTFEIAYRLFRAGGSPIPWIEAGDLNSPQWKALLDLADHNWQASSAVQGKPATRIAAAVAKIGEDRVAAFIAKTVEALAARQPAPMSGAGMTMLRQILRWAQAKPELAVDEALYRLCGIRWEPAVTRVGLMKEWVGTLLQTLTLRDRDRAFACAERLANNPDTKVFHEVIGLYEQYMSEMVLDVPSSRQEGVDGFPIDSELHRIIDSFLRASAPRPMAFEGTIRQSTPAQATHLELALRQSKDDYPALLRAMNERVHWLAKHEPPTAPGTGRNMPWLSWRCDLGQLYGRILREQPALDAADLAALCRVDALGWLGVAPTGPLLNACEAWISVNGFDPKLTGAMQDWQKSVFGSGTSMALRKHIGWLLWFDTAASINEKACWSAVIRKDLRGMPPKLSGAWIALLRNVSFGISDKPTKKWLKPAEKLLQQVGAEEFQSRVRAWFAPFQTGRDLKITVAGRDILGSLFWYSQLAKDPSVDEAVRWFATAKWKAKTDRERTARLLPIWIVTMMERSDELALEAIHTYRDTGQLQLMGTSIELYEELCRRHGRKPQIAAPPPPPKIDKEAMMAKAMQKAMGSVLGGAAQLEGDSVVVSNAIDGERYEIGLRDGRIVRLSDSKIVRLEIDWSVPPFSPFKSMIDVGDMTNPFGRNYFRAMLCAQVLSGAMPIPVPIVEDES